MMAWQSAVLIWTSGSVFAVFHSFTAAQPCKSWFYRHGIREPKYRLLYSMLAIITTVAWIYYVHQLPDAPLYLTGGISRAMLTALQVIGLLVAIAAFQPIDGLVFLGLRKAKSGTDPFVVCGIYRWLRHPMYAGAMLILLAMPEQTWNGLHFTLVVYLYFIIGSRFEESRMLREHPDYAPYRQRVPAFVPTFRKVFELQDK